MNDGEIEMTANESSNTVVENHSEAAPAPSLPQREKSRAGSWIVALVACLVLAAGIYTGIRSRAHAESVLAHATQAAAIPSVSVVHPTSGSAAQEIALPGSTE